MLILFIVSAHAKVYPIHFVTGLKDLSSPFRLKIQYKCPLFRQLSLLMLKEPYNIKTILESKRRVVRFELNSLKHN